MQTQTTKQNEIPSIAAVITHDVENFETWKKAYDEHAPVRRAAGIIATHINRHAEAPNRLSIYLAGSDAAALQAFLSSTELMTVMLEAGVKGPPHVAMITPVEDLTVKDRALAGLIVRHEVRDYAAWKVGFDGHATARARAGIIGHAVNRSLANGNVVVVYVQAESLDALRAFASSTDLKDTMKAAGVVGAPELMFVNGDNWES